jgi:hypothetical protein
MSQAKLDVCLIRSAPGPLLQMAEDQVHVGFVCVWVIGEVKRVEQVVGARETARTAQWDA